MQAWAAVAVEPWKVEYREVEVPDPGPQDVVVHVRHSWISNGTEGSFIRGERIAGDTPRSEQDPLPFPHVPGYQKVGIVEQVGSEVQGIQPGEVVFASISRVRGMFYDFGGHVSPAVTHESQIWKLPPALDPVEAAGLVLTQVGYNVGMRPQIGPREPAVVIGDGMVGQWTAQTLQARGARVLLLGRHEERLNLWTPREGDATLNASLQADWLERIRAWAPEGVQVLCDTVGSLSTVEAILPLMRHNGHISSAGFYGHQGRIDIQALRSREITLHAPAGWSRSRMNITLDLVARGVLRTRPLITHRFPAARAAEAYDLILGRREPVLGVILDWE